MSTTKVGPKHQVTIPKDAFEKLHLEVGDLLEAEIFQGKLVLVPKRLVEKAPVAPLTAKEQELVSRARTKISQIRRDLASAQGLTAAEADVAVKASLIDRGQRWWWMEDWQKGERESERDLRRGRAKRFETTEQLFKDLRSR